MNIAYNAALQTAKMALAASGYRPAKGGNSHYYTLQSLSLTIGLDAASLRKLEVFRKRRNTTEYDHAGVSSDRDAEEMHSLATTVRDAVLTWLGTSHSELLNE